MLEIAPAARAFPGVRFREPELVATGAGSRARRASETGESSKDRFTGARAEFSGTVRIPPVPPASRNGLPWWLVGVMVTFTFFNLAAEAQISKGRKILIDRGLQVQALAQDDCLVTLNKYTNAHYSSINWINEVGADGLPTHSSRQPWLGEPPGFPWSRWAKAETQMPPHVTPYGGDEAPYLSQLIALNLGDEWHLNDAAVRNRLVNWFLAVRTNWPNTILYHNNWGTQVGDAELADFYTRARPDMLCFDTYPWKSVWDASRPDHIGPPIAGPPTAWYSDLRRYREHGRGAGIPLGVYRQTFHAVQDYDTTVYRDPSPSELRLNTFAAMAFSATFFTDFLYNTGAASLFTKTFNGSGDSVIATNGLYEEMADVNRCARNFGKAMVRLTPITTEGIPGYTTSMLFIRGKNGSGVLNPIPIGFVGDRDNGAAGAPFTDWVYQRNDEYLTNWVVRNPGTKNRGEPGDVILSWFKPLDESFDGPGHSNEVYLMVVNGLADTNGTPADCLQQITLKFDSHIGGVEMLDPASGAAKLHPLPLVSGQRQLLLELNGGDAALFKFADGAPFVGMQLLPVAGQPLITIHPADRANASGSDATFTSFAYGAGTLAYRWQFNGVSIPGATNNTLTLKQVRPSDAGNYRVAVSNSFGVVTSTPAALTIVSSTPILFEPFDYRNIGGPVSSNTPANWRFGGTGTNDFNVADGNLVYPGLALSTGNSATNGAVGLGVRRLLGTNFASGKVYFSALFRMNDFGFGAGGWLGTPTQVGALTASDNTTFRLAVMVKSNSPNAYVIGVQKGGSGATATFDPTERRSGKTIFLIGQYDFVASPNTVRLWIDPSPSTFGQNAVPPGAITASTGTDGFGIDRFNFRQNTAASVPGAMQWDELRVGTSWLDVTPPSVPPGPELSIRSLGDGKLLLAGSSWPGRMDVEGSTNLVNWGEVTNLWSDVGVFQFTEWTSNAAEKYFRASFSR